MAAAFPVLRVFRFAYWTPGGDYRVFEVVAANYAEAVFAACAVTDSDTLDIAYGKYEHRGHQLGVTEHPLRGFLHTPTTHTERQLAALYPIDPRD